MTGAAMGSRVKSLSIPEDSENKFYRRLQEIKERMGRGGTEISDSGAIVWIILNSKRILFESDMYRRMMEEAEAHEALFEQKRMREEPYEGNY
ncbi:MAG: hypothetical protein HXS54_01505 [Theionarchaea archaeon]|nr:hypothetical protein [Theionarchaea archaeon]